MVMSGCPQKPNKNMEKRASETENLRINFCTMSQNDMLGIIQTRFRKVSMRTQLIFRDKRSFEIFEFVFLFSFGHRW